MEIAQTGQTSDRLLINIDRARAINQFLGGAFVGPYEVDELPDELIERIMGMRDELPEMRNAQARLEEIKQNWRKNVIR